MGPLAINSPKKSNFVEELKKIVCVLFCNGSPCAANAGRQNAGTEYQQWTVQLEVVVGAVQRRGGGGLL